jgi:hypothetical protein
LWLAEIPLTIFHDFQSSHKSGRVRPPKVWAEEEEHQLRELYEEFRIANGEYECCCCFVLKYLGHHHHRRRRRRHHHPLNFLPDWNTF